MENKWIKTAHRGVRYYEHPTRKHGKKKDRYYAVRFRTDGKLHEYGVGWLSEGIPEELKKNYPDNEFEAYAYDQRKFFKGNVKTGSGAKSPKEKRKIAKEKEIAEITEQKRLEKDAIPFDTFFTETYLPLAKSMKKESSTNREEGLYSVWIKPIIGHFPMKDIAPFTLEKLKQHMAGKKQSPRSIEYALAVIRQVYNTAKRSGHYKGEPPTVNVKSPKIDNGRMRFLTKTEATALLKLLNKERSKDVHDMTLLSLHAGLRFGEIASLTWQDIDLTKGVLTIRDAKAGSRYAFLTPQTTDMIKNRDQGKPSEYVFQGRKGKLDRLSLTFFRAVAELKLNEGIDDPRLKICFYSCRHSYASWLIEQGADLYTVQKLLGHKINVMTQRYAHLTENRLRDAAKALGASWGQDETNGQKEAGQVVDFPK